MASTRSTKVINWRGKKGFWFILAALLITIHFVKSRKESQVLSGDSLNNCRTIAMGSAQRVVKFKPGEQMLKIEVREKEKSPWIVGRPGTQLDIYEPDGGWVCAEYSDGKVVCTNDGEPPKNSFSYSQFRLRGGGGNGYAIVVSRPVNAKRRCS